jgi:hypothetical protein
MSKLNRWKSGTALLIALGLTTGAVAPLMTTLINPAPVFAQTTGFSDVPSGYWARDFIAELAQRNIIAGFPDGTFRPEAAVTRAQFAAMVRKAFNKNKVRNSTTFVDVSSSYWAYSAIQEAYQMGFLAGYPGNVFNPEQKIPREQVLVSLANGLTYTATNAVATDLQIYNDTSSISDYARNSIAAATEKQIVVNYPNVSSLNPGRNATRAEVAAFIYQALVSSGEATALNSPYIVGTRQVATEFRIPAGTTLPVNYNKDKILVTADEKAPLTLTVGANVTTSDGTVLIPSGSQISGQLQPATGGTQFVAQNLTLPNGRQYALNASSQIITKTEQIKKGTSVTTIVKDAALGAAAAAAVSAVTGDRAIATEEVLGGLGIGGLIGLFTGKSTVDLVVVDPQTDLNLKLNQDLVISTR